MTSKIKNIQLICNTTKKTGKVAKLAIAAIEKYGFNLVDENPELVIAIGGDGTFLQALRATNFSSKPMYVGIHTGHLGFMLELGINDIDTLFQSILRDDYKHETLRLEDIEVYTETGIVSLKAFNELSVRDKGSKTLHLDMYINDTLLQEWAGSEVLVSTSTGSTAYTMSAGGSIVYPTINILQIISIAPLNSKAYRTIRNSIIVPENMVVSLIPQQRHKGKMLLILDGVNYEFNHVDKVEVTTAKQGVEVMRLNQYDYWTRLKEKFI